MLKRVVLCAGAINVCWLLMFLAFGAPSLAAISVVSVLMYGASYALLSRRQNQAAVLLIWLEVGGHAALGSVLLGWDSGYHYYLLLFIPALVVGTPARLAMPLTGLLILLYGGLFAACDMLGPQLPLPKQQLQITQWVNIALSFAMFYGVAAFYRSAVLRAERRLLHMATVDPLTGLANRAQFHVRAAAELSRSRAQRQPAALLLADVDFFKRINDQYGHDAGDKVLLRLAELMRRQLGDQDILARWGGEEFLALLPQRDAQQAWGVAERLREAVASVQIDAGGRLVSVTMSFGLAEVGEDGDLQQATLRADRALYRSKDDGRNRVTVSPASESGPDPAGPEQEGLPTIPACQDPPSASSSASPTSARATARPSAA